MSILIYYIRHNITITVTMESNLPELPHEQSLHLSILSKVTDLIHRSRINVSKTQFKYISQTIDEYKKQSNKKMSLPSFLNAVLPYDRQPTKKIKTSIDPCFGKGCGLKVDFKMVEKDDESVPIEVESWNVQIAVVEEGREERTEIVVDFFGEMLRILNKLPLCRIYQMNKEMRNKYKIVGKCQYYCLEKNNLNSSEMMTFKAQQCIQKTGRSMSFKAIAYYRPSLRFLDPIKALTPVKKQKLADTFADSDEDDKVQIYSFYDPDLDFTFITSDKEEIKQKDKVEKVNVGTQEESDDFELLIQTDDQTFMYRVEEQIDTLIVKQPQYFGN